jgi:hypothetical protein
MRETTRADRKADDGAGNTIPAGTLERWRLKYDGRRGVQGVEEYGERRG